MSGIYKAGDYRLGMFSFFLLSEKPVDERKGYYERLPYNQRSMRSIYHTRQYNVNRLAQVRLPSFPFLLLLMPSQLTNPDIFLSHDWPQSIERHGNLRALLKLKPGFRASVHADTLGSPPLMMLLKTLKPKWWFAGHIHVRFQAEVKHARDTQGTQRGKQVQEAGLGKEKEVQDNERTTRFLALDKCLPGRDFLEVPILSHFSPPLLTSFFLAGNRLPHPLLLLPLSSTTNIRPRMARHHTRVSSFLITRARAGAFSERSGG